MANADARWDNKDPEWVKRTIWNYALSYADFVVKYDIPLRRATKAELDEAIAKDLPPVGFVDHSRLSTNRSDPGATFPWTLFFDNIREIIAASEEEDDMAITVRDIWAYAYKGRQALSYLVTGTAPAWTTRCMALRWANSLVPPQASSTAYTS